MANKVANVDDVTDAITGLAEADRGQRKAHGRPAPQAMPTNMLRSHLHRVPKSAAAVAEPVVGPTSRVGAEAATSFAAVGRTAVGSGAVTAMAANAFDGRLFVANYADDAVAVLDGHTLGVVSTITDVPEPYALTVAQGRAYVSALDCGQDVVAVLDTESVVGSHPLPGTVQDVVVDREGRQVYVARSGDDGADLAVIDTATGRVRVVELASRAGEAAHTLRLSGDGRTLFVTTTDQLGGRLVAINTAELRVIDSLTVVEPIRGLAVSHDGATVWVATDDAQAGGLVDAVDMRSRRLLGTVPVGSAVRQLMLSVVGDRVYVVTEESVVVVCANTHEIVDGIDTGSGPSCVAESADGSRLYIADFEGLVALYSVTSATPSLLARMATPEALAGPAVRELERAGV
jgi:DNA-binding beta-propeller fold protein YncE